MAWVKAVPSGAALDPVYVNLDTGIKATVSVSSSLYVIYVNNVPLQMTPLATEQEAVSLLETLIQGYELP